VVVQWHSIILYILGVMGSIPSESILCMILRKNARDKSRTQYIKSKTNITRELFLSA
jgi:uncharacterized membrane protein YesL